MKYANQFHIQRGWKLLMADMELDPVTVLRLAKLPIDLFNCKNASVTPSQYFDFWRALEESKGAEELPLALGKAFSVWGFDPPIVASLCGANLNVAFQRLSDFMRLIGPMSLDVEIGKESTKVTFDCYRNEGQIPRTMATTQLVFLAQVVRLATRQNIVPIELQLTQLPERSAPYEAFFGRKIRKGNVNCIAFSEKDATRPFLTENDALWIVFEPILKKRVRDLDQLSSVQQRVKVTLIEMLPNGQSSIEETANRLGVSKRTLQRCLSEESISYQKVLNEVRLELAEKYLVNSEISPGEISYLLGFQDSNSFVRAFKGWTGMTPGSYRQAPRNGESLNSRVLEDARV